jgi:2-polyprenyl-3-methyl-5-hydroxy-6-metoxy-1,4-benzoquinol methylase
MRFRIDRHDLRGVVEVLEPWAETPRGAFDAVVAMDVIEHLPNASEVLRDRILLARKPAGVLIENSPFVVNSGNPMHHEDFGFEEFMRTQGLVKAEPVGEARVWGDCAVSNDAP